MTTLVKKYPVFEDNQVLTSSQLNSLVDYLDQQNRLTRVTLIGVGILCGIELSCESVNGADQLIISGGVGVTSEGFLIKMKNCVNTKLREYTLPEGALYEPFLDPLTDEQDVVLKELLTETADFDDQDEVISIDKNNINDLVVMLFVECFDKDLKSCLGKSCDQLGIDRFLTIRKLVVSKTDYIKIRNRTEGGYQDVQFPDQFSLPKVVMPRTLFFPNRPHSKNYLQYSVNYLIQILGISNELFSGLKQSYEVYRPILESSYASNPFESNQINATLEEWLKYLFGIDGSPLPFLGMQYFADFMKDLVQAYCEFREKACLLTALCCPDMDRFPKHLTLGVLDNTVPGGVSPALRHQFTQPPVYGNQKGLTEQVIRLHRKLVAMIQSFDLERLRNPTQTELQLKITPSCEKKSLMSERSIPMYYNLNKAKGFDKLGAFEKNWLASIKSGFGRDLLSYDKNQGNVPIQNPVATPLDFDLDPYDFLRVEGHVGKGIKEVMEKIEAYKTDKNLAFDVKAVYLGENGLAMPLPDCLCADLQPDYSIWRNKTLFFLKSLLAMTSGLGNLLGKRKSVSKAVLSEFETDRSNFDLQATGAVAGKLSAQPLTGGFEKVGPIKVNQAKLTNLSDIRIDVNRENWHLAGQQLINGIDKFNTANQAPNEPQNLAAFAERRTAKDYFDLFNKCLCQLIDSMPVDLKDFDLEAWKKHYACMLQPHIEVMKQLADQATNAKAALQAYIIIFIYCVVYRVLCRMAIYPYISIGVIAQTLDFRKEGYLKSLKFSNFLKKHPGAEHKAGVAPGETLLLLYLADELEAFPLGEFGGPNNEGAVAKPDLLFNLEKLIIPDGDFNENKFQEIVKGFKNGIVGDFTLPYICCDECSDMPNAPLPLNPVALPACGVVLVTFNRETEVQLPFFNDYRPLKMKMISYLYERETFRTRLITNPKFGTATFEMIDSKIEFKIVKGEKEEARKIEEMTYVVDLGEIQKAYKQNPDVGIIVDEFEYEYFNVADPDRSICKSTISVFIPVIPMTADQEEKTATVTGVVFRDNEPFSRARVSIKGSNIVKPVETTDNGDFALLEVPESDATIVVEHTDIFTEEVPVSIKAPDTDIGIINVRSRVIIDVAVLDEFDGVFTVIGVKEQSAEAVNIINYYVENTNQFKSNMAVLSKRGSAAIKPVLTNSTTLVKEMSDTPGIPIGKLNNRFAKGVTEIDTTFEKIKPAERPLLQEAMKNVTLSYLQRLSIVEPKTLSKSTVTRMRQVAKKMTKEKYPELKTNIDEWVNKSDGNVSEGFLTGVTNSFKLR